MRFVTSDLAAWRSLADVARAAGLERAYFSVYFRKFVGCTFSQWNARIRVLTAKHLLEEGNARIGEIAAAVGYSDVTTFTRNFRKYARCAPREHRKQNSERIKTIAENFTTNAETRQRPQM
jgi:AraC-like DNA-binding protein